MRSFAFLVTALLALAISGAAQAQTVKSADWTLRDFHFHTGEVLPELRMHYATLGEPSGLPVLMLHGTGGNGEGMVTPAYRQELFGPGRPLDIRKYFIILPDAIGAGKSSKPSDGLGAKFPHYNQDDLVAAQYRFLTEGLGIRHLRLVTGVSGGGMLTWIWGEAHPGFMGALVPLASQPSAMAARNWMMRRALVEAIKDDPGYNNGNYTAQPHAMRMASVLFGIATSGGTQAYQKQAPTRALADKLVEDRMAAPFRTDANDYIWQWESSRDYDPAPGLDRITAPVLAINSADDERNPAETGVTAQNIKRLKQGRLYLIPASPDTRGHGTTGIASLWADQLGSFMATLR